LGQYNEYKIGPNGDTINAINKEGQRVGKWVEEVAATRGEPGYTEEGFYKKGQKDSIWRRYTKEGDLLAFERYMNGGKAGLQQYFTFLGELEHEESWKGYDPDHPYDTIPVYGTGSGEIIDFKVVKAEPYSVKEGEWRYYDPETGRLLKKEQWSNNNLYDPNAPKKVTAATPYKKPEKVEKTAEMLEWERKNRGKKFVDGRTGL
jgi:antitoxin component YwqK of YwqJK toxin-antitoxin module